MRKKKGSMEEHKKEIMGYRQQGKTIKEIGELTGFSVGALSGFLKECGFPSGYRARCSGTATKQKEEKLTYAVPRKAGNAVIRDGTKVYRDVTEMYAGW